MKIKEQEIPLLIRQGKDREVIPVLYKTLFPKVKSYILRNSGSKQDADDIFQEAVLVFYKQVIDRKFDEKYTVFGYVYRLCINRWFNKVRKDSRLVFVEDYKEDDHHPGVDAFELIELDLVLNNENLLDKLFSNIGEKCIEILTYTVYYDLMMEDIKIRMGLGTDSAVKMQLKRCREKLIREIENNPSILNKLKGYE